MLVLLAAIPVFIGIAVKVSTPRPGEGPPFVSELTNNGLFLAFTALAVCLPVFLPLAIAVVSGDAIAGEAGAGTLQVPAGHPGLSHAGCWSSRASACWSSPQSGCWWSRSAGWWSEPCCSASTASPCSPATRSPSATGSAGRGYVAAYAFVDLIGLAAIGVFFSTLTEVPVGAMAGTVVSAITFAVLDSVPQLGRFRELLLTHNWLNFDELLRTNYDVGSLVRWSLLSLGYAVVFFLAAWARITTADVSG